MNCPNCGAGLPGSPARCPGCGASLSYEVKTPGGRNAETLPQRTRLNWRINAICLVGALAGFFSVFRIWARVNFNLIDLLNFAAEWNSDEGTQVFLACVLILAGIALAFLSSVGAILQLIGISLYLEWFLSESGGKLPSVAGPYVAIAACIIILFGVARPLGPGYSGEPPGAKERLLIFSRKRAMMPTIEPSAAQSDWVGKYCKYCGRPMAEDTTMCPSCGRSAEEEMPEKRP